MSEQMKISSISEHRLAEDIWLHYFNRVLFVKKIITEQEHNRMNALIDARKNHPPTK